MKIINRKDFLALPAGVLFSKYAPCYFECMEIKEDSLCNDFISQQINGSVRSKGESEFADILLAAQETGESFSMDFDACGRDGMFDEDQLFAIWEPADVKALIERLQRLVS